MSPSDTESKHLIVISQRADTELSRPLPFILTSFLHYSPGLQHLCKLFSQLFREREESVDTPPHHSSTDWGTTHMLCRKTQGKHQPCCFSSFDPKCLRGCTEKKWRVFIFSFAHTCWASPLNIWTVPTYQEDNCTSALNKPTVKLLASCSNNGTRTICQTSTFTHIAYSRTFSEPPSPQCPPLIEAEQLFKNMSLGPDMLYFWHATLLMTISHSFDIFHTPKGQLWEWTSDQRKIKL